MCGIGVTSRIDFTSRPTVCSARIADSRPDPGPLTRTSSERIRRLSAQLVVYDEVGKAIGESRDLQTLLDVILQQLSSATRADWGLFLLRSQFSERLELRGLPIRGLAVQRRRAGGDERRPEDIDDALGVRHGLLHVRRGLSVWKGSVRAASGRPRCQRSQDLPREYVCGRSR